MLQSMFDNFFPILSALVFVAVLLLLEGLHMMWNSAHGPAAKKIERRLRVLSASTESHVQARLLRQRGDSEPALLERLVQRLPRAHRIERMLQQANLDWAVSRLVLTCVLPGAAAFGICWFVLRQPLFASTVAGVALTVAPLAWVRRRRAKRMKKLEQQLPDALDLLARALRAGHAFGAGLQMIGEEMSEPIASEFRFVHDEINFGVSLERALTNLSVRVPLTDLRYFVVAVLIQRESGGNLTEVLASLSRLIRERLKLFWRVRILSAEGRLSAWVLGVMPFGLAALMNIFNPEFMSPLWTDPIGIAIVRNMLLLMAFGVLVLRQITRIRV